MKNKWWDAQFDLTAIKQYYKENSNTLTDNQATSNYQIQIAQLSQNDFEKLLLKENPMQNTVKKIYTSLTDKFIPILNRKALRAAYQFWDFAINFKTCYEL